jgi:hypothetical protein
MLEHSVRATLQREPRPGHPGGSNVRRHSCRVLLTWPSMVRASSTRPRSRKPRRLSIAWRTAAATCGAARRQYSGARMEGWDPPTSSVAIARAQVPGRDRYPRRRDPGPLCSRYAPGHRPPRPARHPGWAFEDGGSGTPAREGQPAVSDLGLMMGRPTREPVVARREGPRWGDPTGPPTRDQSGIDCGGARGSPPVRARTTTITGASSRQSSRGDDQWTGPGAGARSWAWDRQVQIGQEPSSWAATWNGAGRHSGRRAEAPRSTARWPQAVSACRPCPGTMTAP